MSKKYESGSLVRGDTSIVVMSEPLFVKVKRPIDKGELLLYTLCSTCRRIEADCKERGRCALFIDLHE